MGKLISWGLDNHQTRNCEYCGMPKAGSDLNILGVKNNCCKDEHKQIKTEKDQKLVLNELQILKLFPDASAVHLMNAPAFQVSSLSYAHPTTHAPPGIGKQPVFLLNCNFRI
jgi:hypothetical protein